MKRGEVHSTYARKKEHWNRKRKTATTEPVIGFAFRFISKCIRIENRKEIRRSLSKLGIFIIWWALNTVRSVYKGNDRRNKNLFKRIASTIGRSLQINNLNEQFYHIPHHLIRCRRRKKICLVSAIIIIWNGYLDCLRKGQLIVSTTTYAKHYSWFIQLKYK